NLICDGNGVQAPRKKMALNKTTTSDKSPELPVIQSFTGRLILHECSWTVRHTGLSSAMTELKPGPLRSGTWVEAHIQAWTTRDGLVVNGVSTPATKQLKKTQN